MEMILSILSQMPLPFKISLGFFSVVFVASAVLLVVTIRKPEDPRDVEAAAEKKRNKAKKKIEQLQKKGMEVPDSLLEQASVQQEKKQKSSQKTKAGAQASAKTSSSRQNAVSSAKAAPKKASPARSDGSAKTIRRTGQADGTVITPRQKKWMRLLVKDRLSRLKESDETPDNTELSALHSITNHLEDLEVWEDLYPVTGSASVIGVSNRIILTRMEQYVTRPDKTGMLCELLYLLDCVNGGPNPLDGDTELLPEGIDIGSTIISVLQEYRKVHQEVRGKVPFKDTRRASLEIAETEDLFELSAAPLNVVTRVIIEDLHDEVFEDENIECMISDESTYYIRILLSMLAGEIYDAAIEEYQPQTAAG